MEIAETETATGQLDDATLDALAEVSVYLPGRDAGRSTARFTARR